MGKRILLIGYKAKIFDSMQQFIWRYSKFICMMPNMATAVKALSEDDNYLIIIALPNDVEDTFLLNLVRNTTKVPIIVLREEYSSMEKTAFIKAGADEYLSWPEEPGDFLASCYALIRRYTVLNRKGNKPINIILQGDVVMDRDLRKVYIQGIEMHFTQQEFDIFCLIASNPGRVYTYEQIYTQIGDMDQVFIENSLHSCVRRIRRKLDVVPGCSCSIVNVRGVGYCFRQNNS